ncbi:hypothetical protein BG015_000650 [Linnemannia schmuckeri]|uniref:Uncharacterized protein n=1 Tax=Linnemannia schmuckeri TaxID=64567 RepID=A0A9P5V7A9_9FUNG|nr:hypothetical protein BG015_000650 [Linnemannia schmuckeri]
MPNNMTSTTSTKNSFALNELTQRLSKFDATKDAVSSRLQYLLAICRSPTETIARHGHRIRIAKNVKSLSQVSALTSSSVNKLRKLHMRATASPSLHIRTYEVVLRNRVSLQNFYLFANTSSFNQHESSANYVLTLAFVSLSAVSPSNLSKLTRLKIEQLCLTHDSLVEVLRGCPKLSDLRLPYTDVVGIPIQSFQHTGVSFFASNFKNLFESYKVPRATAFSWWIVPVAGIYPSLLSYFPNLTTSSVCNYTANTTIPSVEIKEAISQHYSRLTGFQLEHFTGTIVFEFLMDIADRVSQLVIRHNNMSVQMIKTIFLPQHSLITLMHFSMSPGFNFEDDKVASVHTRSQAIGQSPTADAEEVLTVEDFGTSL